MFSKLFTTVVELLPPLLVTLDDEFPLPGPVGTAVINVEIDEAFCNWLVLDDVEEGEGLRLDDVNPVCPVVFNMFCGAGEF